MNWRRAPGLLLLVSVGAGLLVGTARPSGQEAASARVPSAGQPRLFAEGVISTPDDEFGGTFSPDGRTFLYCKSVPRSQFYVVCESRYENGRWTAPRIPSFSGRYRDSDPIFSTDGSRVYFVSDRPVSGVDRKNYDVWVVDRKGSAWGEPRNLGPPVNSEKSEYFVSFTRDGTIYFTSAREGSLGLIDAYRSRLVDGKYSEPENLGEAINGKGWSNVEAWVDPDESLLLVGAFGHTDGAGDCDIFVSYRREGVWGPLKALGPKVNTPAREYSPRISPDGKTLFFTSERGMPTQARLAPWTYDEFVKASTSTANGLGNIYTIRLEDALEGTR